MSIQTKSNLIILFAITSHSYFNIMMVEFGAEGKDFSWSGEAFNSVVEENLVSNEFTRVFFTNILDEQAGELPSYDTKALDEAVNEYFSDILIMKNEITSSWQSYIDDLNARGLKEYCGLIESYPLTNS